MSKLALERKDMWVETAAGPEEPEIRQASPLDQKENHEEYSVEASAAINTS